MPPPPRFLPRHETQPPSSPEDSKPETEKTIPETQASSSTVRNQVPKYPLGYRFKPLDEELILYYLKPFLHGEHVPNIEIHHVNIYKYHPIQLTGGFKKANDSEWFFLTERTKKYEGGTRPDCSADGGYWKAVGCETKIIAGEGVVGSKRSLDFRMGKQPNGVKTEWIMQEYRLDHPLPPKTHGNNNMLDIVLCKIYMSPKGKKRRAEENNEDENDTRREYILPCPSPFDELSSIFQPPIHQETSRLVDISLYQTLLDL